MHCCSQLVFIYCTQMHAFQGPGEGGSMLGRQTVKVIRQILDRAAGVATSTRSVDVLSDAVSSQKTPLRFPSIISKFR